MWNVEILESSNENVRKFIFKKEDAIAEAVLYKYPTYEDRTVMCISTQSGCPMGCTFCFEPGVPVLMADMTYKRIADIKVGDVVAANRLTKASADDTSYASPSTSESRVINTISRDYSGRMIKLHTKSGKVLRSTEDHPVALSTEMYRTKFIPSKEAKLGDSLLVTSFEEHIPTEGWELGWLRGFLDGNSYTCLRKGAYEETCTVSTKYRNAAVKAKALCDSLMVVSTSIWDQDLDGTICYRFEIQGSSLSVLEDLRSQSLSYSTGYLAGAWDASGLSFKNTTTARLSTSKKHFADRIISCAKGTPHCNYTGGMYNIDLQVNRLDFLSTYGPVTSKKNFLDEKSPSNMMIFDEIVRIEDYSYEGPVYDLTTTESTFIADNTLVHNCGTGEFFNRNLTQKEIVGQVLHMKREMDVCLTDVKNLQIMVMSMGDPLLNMGNVANAFRELHRCAPEAKLLVSTSAPLSPNGWEHMMAVAEEIPTVGLQFSVHESTDEDRNKLIPFPAKMNLQQIADKGVKFFARTGRHPFFNYCVHEENSDVMDARRLLQLFDPKIWQATLSVICESDQDMSQAVAEKAIMTKGFSDMLGQFGFSTRVFDPAGQDDIGGGCGQLWQVQEWAKENPELMKRSLGSKYIKLE